MPRGRPPKPIDANASAAARLGAQLRGSHVAHDLTLAGIDERAVIVWGTEHPWPAARRSVMAPYTDMPERDPSPDALGRFLEALARVEAERDAEIPVWGPDGQEIGTERLPGTRMHEGLDVSASDLFGPARPR